MSDSKSDRSQVLRAAAARKHHDAVQRAERAIRQLVKEARPVTFSDESRASASSTGAQPSRSRQSTPTPRARSSAPSPCRPPR